jgi:tetratricopeptide (TPR) repeat protein
MRVHLEWTEGFRLCVLFSDSSVALREVRQSVDETWTGRGDPVIGLNPRRGSDVLADVFGTLATFAQAASGRDALVWLELTAADFDGDDEWELARASCLARLNEARSWLQQDYGQALVLCLPLAWADRVYTEAPDLWHVRSFTATLLAESQPSMSLSTLLDLGEHEMLDVPSMQAASQSLAGAHERVEQSGSLADQIELVHSLSNWSLAAQASGDSYAAQAAAGDAVTRMRKVRLEQGDRAQVLRDLAIALNGLGDVQRRDGQYEAALESYREGLELRRNLREILGDSPDVLRGLSVSLNRFGDALRRMGSSESALLAYSEALTLRRQLRASLGDSPQILRDLTVVHNKIATVLGDLGQLDEALVHCRQSLALRRQLRADLGDSPQVLRDLSVSLNKLGDVLHDRGETVDALEAYGESLGLRRDVRATVGDTAQALRDVATVLQRMGDAERSLGHEDAASVSYGESLDLRRTLRDMQGDAPLVLDDLVKGLLRSAKLSSPGGPAESLIAEAAQLNEKLLDAATSEHAREGFAQRQQEILALQSRDPPAR